MTTHTIGKNQYYNCDELRNQYPKIFRGCINSRAFITKKDVPDDAYIYGKLKSKKWVESNGNSMRFDKIFIKVDWFDNKYLNFRDDHEEEEEEDIEDAPGLIKLKDNEKFINNDGNIVEIEVRGEKNVDECYFKIKDIMNGFNLPHLHKNIIKEKSGYQEGKDYIYFNVNVNSHQAKVKKLFLTYIGLLRILFSSRSKTSEKFVRWATKTLFTAQMGTFEQKNKLVTNILGVSPQAVKEVLNKSSSRVSCAYLFSLGRVKNLRVSLNIPSKYSDDDYVYKFGNTDDLETRMYQHLTQTFKNIDGITLELVLFSYIDSQFTTDAESKIRHMMAETGLKLEHETFTELSIIPKQRMKFVKEQYDTIYKSCMGNVGNIVAQLKEKESINIQQKYQLENKDLQLKLMQEECSNKLAQMELHHLKLQMASMKKSK